MVFEPDEQLLPLPLSPEPPRCLKCETAMVPHKELLPWECGLCGAPPGTRAGAVCPHCEVKDFTCWDCLNDAEEVANEFLSCEHPPVAVEEETRPDFCDPEHWYKGSKRKGCLCDTCPKEIVYLWRSTQQTVAICGSCRTEVVKGHLRIPNRPRPLDATHRQQHWEATGVALPPVIGQDTRPHDAALRGL